MAKQRVKAEARFGSEKKGGCRARVPADVRDRLGARTGDTLIFEEGSAHVAESAALKGVYFVVRLAERAPDENAMEQTAPSAPAEIESFAVAVMRKREQRVTGKEIVL